ncbi:MAG: vanadium-dependent haloperoxidase [Bacteroidota bacterium]
MKKQILLFSTLLLIFSCKKKNENFKTEAANADFLREVEKQVTQVMVHDIFSPPVASRIYFYSSLAAYEALVPGFPNFQSMAGKINKFKPTPQPESGKEYSFEIAARTAYLKIGKTLTFSANLYDEFDKKEAAKYEKIGIPSDVMERSIAYGEAVANHILDYSKGDNYKQTRGFRYTVTQEKGTWVPTPPGYMDGVEPYWSTIRPATLDTSSQFAPEKPYEYNMKDKNSPYYKQVIQVHQAIKNLTDEQRNIANFWDCNPFKLNVTGHAMFATKKISPGGHWMSIVNQISKAKKLNMMETAEAYLLVSMGIYDGFISCWDEKYTYKTVRPETVINMEVDKDWIPTLQTPPFPEYTSGHSVVSAASAAALTKLFGEDFAFADSTELQFGLPVRTFKSFEMAANEASISRFYGGIHFMPALDNGLKQGKKVGEWVLTKAKTRK